jgi:uncharacterized protein (DUF58 family)
MAHASLTQTQSIMSAKAVSLAEALPDLQIKATHLARTLQAGWHGRKKAGSGETFWQFRPLVPGDPASQIDWRKSARDDHLYRRENEWEAAHTFRFFVDLSASMRFASASARMSKQDSIVIAFMALAQVLLNQGERLALLNDPLQAERHYSGMHGFERLMQALLRCEQQSEGATLHPLHPGNTLVLFSDFLDERWMDAALWSNLAGDRRKVFAVHMIDPAEHIFPYQGRTLFEDPETGQTWLAGHSRALQGDYQALFTAHCDQLASLARHHGAMLLTHHTDRPLADLLLSLWLALGEASL